MVVFLLEVKYKSEKKRISPWPILNSTWLFVVLIKT